MTLLFQKPVHGFASLFIGRGCNCASRLVEHEVDLRLGDHRLPVDLDAVFSEVNRRLRITANPAVQTRFPAPDEFHRLRARAEAELGKRTR